MALFLITAAKGVFVSYWWSKWRFGYFDLLMAVAAVIAVFLLPSVFHKFFPIMDGLAGVGASAIIGCLVVDLVKNGLD